MGIQDIDWNQEFRRRHCRYDKAEPGSEEARAVWNAKAPGFAHKPKRSDYIDQLIQALDLAEGESLFDMGCGSGTISIPLAKQGHDIVAVDFSDGMLAELTAAAEREGVSDRIRTFQRSWQEDWAGLPKADVALSSRSFITDDLADGVAKLEGQANKRVVITTGAGDLPYRDSRIYAAMGREEMAVMLPMELIVLADFLWMRGRLPRISYIESAGVWHRPTKEELTEAVKGSHRPENPAEEEALDAFLAEHMVHDAENDRWIMDYPRTDRWAVVDWDVPAL